MSREGAAGRLGRALAVAALAVLVGGCGAQTLRYRFAPPAEAGDPFLGVAATRATGPLGVAEGEGAEKRGSARAYSILSLVAWGNSGAAEAARNGGVAVIEAADVEIVQVKALGVPIYVRQTTVVRGQ